VKHAVVAAIAALSLGCLDAVIDPLDPKTGPALVDRCVNDDSDPDTDVSFSRDIQPIFAKMTAQPGCGCHIPTNPNPIGFEQAGLDLSSYAGLRRGGNNSLAGAVVEGAPCDSVLWQKISPGPPFGSRMPFDGPPFLDEATRRLIADWIAEGARDD
jgi:hypothetical protein